MKVKKEMVLKSSQKERSIRSTAEPLQLLLTLLSVMFRRIVHKKDTALETIRTIAFEKSIKKNILSIRKTSFNL